MTPAHFLTTLTLCAVGLIAGCGGGGSGSAREAPGTVTVYATGLSNPMHMVFDSAGVLYTANKGANNIAKTVSVLNTEFKSLGGATNPIGIGIWNGTFYSTILVAGQQGLWQINLTNPASNQVINFPLALNANFSGFAFDNNGIVFVADQTNLSVDWLGGSKTSIQSPTGVTHRNGLIYIASWVSSGKVYIYNPADDSLNELGNGNLSFDYPYSVAFDSSGNAYVVEFGSDSNGINGALSQISKVTIAGVKSVFADATKGLCASVGIAIRDDYVYVSNGSCASDPTKSNRILKIAI